MSKTQKDYNVTELILRVREGDQQAFSVLLDMYKPLLDSQVARLMSGDDLVRRNEEDLRQEATLVFYNAILTYDESQSEVEFGLYARICISNALVSQMRVMNRRRAEQLAVLDDGYFEATVNDPSDYLIQKEALDRLYSLIRQNLSDYEYAIWQSYMLGKTAKQIGDRLGRDEKSVSNAIYRIRRKLRALLK